MIDPVTGGYATEAEIRIHLDKLRALYMSYHTLDRQSGGLFLLSDNIRQLELVLKGTSSMSSLRDAQHEFLKRNSAVKWVSGVPTWDHYELVDGEWQITTYEVSVDLTNPRNRTEAVLGL